jgi:superfamily I DNA/RNA helicase
LLQQRVCENAGLACDAVSVHTEAERIAREVYSRYTDTCVERNVVDYGDMLMLPLRIMEHDAEALAEIREQYTHIFVDEVRVQTLAVKSSRTASLTAIIACPKYLV